MGRKHNPTNYIKFAPAGLIRTSHLTVRTSRFVVITPSRVPSLMVGCAVYSCWGAIGYEVHPFPDKVRFSRLHGAFLHIYPFTINRCGIVYLYFCGGPKRRRKVEEQQHSLPSRDSTRFVGSTTIANAPFANSQGLSAIKLQPISPSYILGHNALFHHTPTRGV